jgi:nucleoid DNA-binding protein
LIFNLKNLKEIKFHNFKKIEKIIEYLKSNSEICSVKFFHCFFSEIDLEKFSTFLVGKKTNKYQTELQKSQFKPFSISLLNDYEEEFSEDDDFDIYGEISKVVLLEEKYELKEIEFSSTPLDKGLNSISEIIGHLKSLEMVKFSFNQINDNENGLMFIKSLLDNENLKEIHITENFIGDQMVSQFCGIANESLKMLNFSNNMITSSGVEKLIDLLNKDTCMIEDLDISSNFIGNESAIKLLCGKSKLKKLNLSFCGIDLGLVSNKYEDFFEKLGDNSNIEIISLSGNSMIHSETLAKMIETNNTLKSLDISDCTLNFTEYLEKSIISNSKIEFYNFSECRLGDKNGKSIANILSSKKSNSSFNLSDNGFTNHFGRILMDSKIKKMEFLDLTQNDFNMEMREFLKEKLATSVEYFFIGFQIGKSRKCEPCDGVQMSTVFEE